MSLRDRFRSHGGPQGEDDSGPVGEAPPDPMNFRPRFDGGYVGGGHPDGTVIVLRFTQSSVSEVIDGADGDGAAGGEYTPSGRFVVQRRFARPIVYSVLAITDDSFEARRTDTNPGGGTTELAFTFRPTEASVDGEQPPGS
jgi:hypothetical protein